MDQGKKTKILTAALSVFLRYGYRRVNMNDIAEAAGMSRPALYLVFKNKEEIFGGVFLQWVDETVATIERETAKAATPEKKLEQAFEIWAVRPFEMVTRSPETKELVDCSFEFAQESVVQGYKRFEAAIVPFLASIAQRRTTRARVSPEIAAHVLANAVRGFKLAATSPGELRQLIKQLLLLAFNGVP